MKGRASAALLALTAVSCAPLTDEVFAPFSLTSTLPIVVEEGAGVVEVPVRLARPRPRDFSLAYQLEGLEAQDTCQSPDFGAADGAVTWPAGALEASVRIWITDDELAERDERFALRLEAADGASLTPLGRIEVVIEDDDRTALLDAQSLGVVPGAAHDQSAALQEALDRSAAAGRGVLVMAPGDYQVRSVTLRPGTTLSARGVRWQRPALAGMDVVSLRAEHAGPEPSATSLVEGLSIDGRRDEQGPYRDHEGQEAHLVAVHGDAAEGGALRVQLEGLTLVSGTGSGLRVGPQTEITVCGLRGSELWRDALTLNGGATLLKLRDFDATETQGTGLWLGAREPGFGDSYRVDVEAEDVRVGAGDVEIEVTDQSRVSLKRLTMTAPPLRLDVLGGSMRIEDSVIMLGPSPANQWGRAHDVEIVNTILVASEAADAKATDPAGTSWSALSLGSLGFSPGPATPGAGRLRFTDCRFELARAARPGESAYALENPDPDTAIVVTSSRLGTAFANWFAPQCHGCELRP